jgi:hypothetical protein
MFNIQRKTLKYWETKKAFCKQVAPARSKNQRNWLNPSLMRTFSQIASLYTEMWVYCKLFASVLPECVFGRPWNRNVCYISCPLGIFYSHIWYILWLFGISMTVKMYYMSIKYTIFHCKALPNLPELGFLVWKNPIWQPWRRRLNFLTDSDSTISIKLKLVWRVHLCPKTTHSDSFCSKSVLIGLLSNGNKPLDLAMVESDLWISAKIRSWDVMYKCRTNNRTNEWGEQSFTTRKLIEETNLNEKLPSLKRPWRVSLHTEWRGGRGREREKHLLIEAD